MTDYNVRDVFSLFTGRCGHKWVAERSWDPCPTWGAGETKPAALHNHYFLCGRVHLLRGRILR
jgi:hypothetical protein